MQAHSFPSRRAIAIAFVFLFLASWAAVSAQPEPPPAAPYLAGEIVVGLTAEAVDAYGLRAPLSRLEAQRQRLDVPAFLELHGALELRPAVSRPGGRLKHLGERYGFDRVFKVRVPAAMDIVRLARVLIADPRVEYAHPNYVGQGGGGQALPDDTYFGDQWNHLNTGQSGGTADADMDTVEAWSTAIGRRETVVAVLDTGIDGDHPEFRGKVIRGGFDFVNTDDDPEGDHSHGTLVSGIVAARTNNDFGVSGVNWRAQILPIKILNSSNSGQTTDLAEGILLTAALGVDVSNLSLIRYPNTTTLRNAVEFADAAGVIQIGCNGNDDNTVLNYPASYPEVLSTGATTRDDLRASFSSFTTTLDVMAPGSSVPTTVYNNQSDFRSFFSGCSAATPNAAGVTSVMLAMDPTLTFVQVRDILRATAEDEVGDPSEDVPGRDNFYGWGRINMADALDALGLVSQRRMHVDQIRLLRRSAAELQARVSVVDDLTGVEQGVLVQATLTLPDSSQLPVSATTDATGLARLTYAPGPTLPPGAYTLTVDDLVLAGFDYDASANVVDAVTHDPDLDGVHVRAIDFRDDFTTLFVEVQVVDDDGVPEGGVQVQGTLTPPFGSIENFSAATRWATSGVVGFEFSPPSGLVPGEYTFEVTQLTKSGFVHETARDVETIDVYIADDATKDPDQDGFLNSTDNCRSIANNDQADADDDGIGDVCDICPSRSDPAQEDSDGDGTGDRCDCAPFDDSTVEVAAVRQLDIDGGGLDWPAVVGADYYDLTRGLLSDLDGADYGACLADNLAATSLGEASIPPLGEGYFYLVGADDATCGPGSLGDDSSASPRQNSNPAGCQP